MALIDCRLTSSFGSNKLISSFEYEMFCQSNCSNVTRGILDPYNSKLIPKGVVMIDERRVG